MAKQRVLDFSVDSDFESDYENSFSNDFDNDFDADIPVRVNRLTYCIVKRIPRSNALS